MKLPDGVPQGSACVLIALREYFDDPDWEDAELVEELRSKNTPDRITARNGELRGYASSKMKALLERAGLFSPPYTISVYAESTNADEMEIIVNGNLRYMFPRNAKCVLSYWTNKEQTSGHTMCMPLHTAFCFATNCRWGYSSLGVDASNMRFVGIRT